MGILTTHITQLCDEIVAKRKQRRALNQELADGTMSRKASVNDLCATLNQDRLGMALKSRKERRAFLNHLKRTVHTQRQDMQADLAGVRFVWSGNDRPAAEERAARHVQHHPRAKSGSAPPKKNSH